MLLSFLHFGEFCCCPSCTLVKFSLVDLNFHLHLMLSTTQPNPHLKNNFSSFVLFKSKSKMAPKPVSLQCKSVFLLFFLITIQTSSSSPLFPSSSSDFNPPYPKAIFVSFLLILLQIMFCFRFHSLRVLVFLVCLLRKFGGKFIFSGSRLTIFLLKKNLVSIVRFRIYIFLSIQFKTFI